MGVGVRTGLSTIVTNNPVSLDRLTIRHPINGKVITAQRETLNRLGLRLIDGASPDSAHRRATGCKPRTDRHESTFNTEWLSCITLKMWAAFRVRQNAGQLITLITGF